MMEVSYHLNGYNMAVNGKDMTELRLKLDTLFTESGFDVHELITFLGLFLGGQCALLDREFEEKFPAAPNPEPMKGFFMAAFAEIYDDKETPLGEIPPVANQN